MADSKKASSSAAAAPKQQAPPKQAASQQQASKAPASPAQAQSKPAASNQAPPVENPSNLDGSTEDLKTGKVKWFSAMRGFGFITPDDGSPDLFVHQSSIYAEGFRSLRDGEPVEYVVDCGEDGRLRANNVTGPKGAYVEGASREDDPAAYYGGNGGPINNNRGGFGRGRGRVGRGGGGGAFGYGGGRCFNCSQSGHLARDCNMARAGCYTCGKQGHFARDCPNQS